MTLLLTMLALCSAATLEDFESYAAPVDDYDLIGAVRLDHTTVASNGQGPGLVARGATYDAGTGQIQWNGEAYFGLETQTILSSTSDGFIRSSTTCPRPR